MRSARAPRVLVVDDRPAELQAAAAALRRQGYEVLAAASAAEALGHLGRTTVDVVVAPLRLARPAPPAHPSLLAELRRYPRQTVAVILTGPPGEVSEADVVREGAYDHLPTPLDAGVLKAVVAQALERVALTRTMRDLVQDLDDANAQLRAFSGELQRRVDQATAELRQKVRELDAANRQLEAARRQREEFIAMVAHELGGPLTAIAGYAQLLGRPGQPAAARERARAAILAQAQRMARLVGDLADAAHLAAGGFRLQLGPCDLRDIAREQVEQARARTRCHTIRLEAPAAPVALVGDRDRLAQVLANLLTNALTHGAGREVAVRLRVEAGRRCCR